MDIIKFFCVGSFCRVWEMVKDLDYIIVIDYLVEVREQFFVLLNIKSVIVSGDMKVFVIFFFEYEISVDFCFVMEEQFLIIFYYFMGLKDYNIKMC